MELWDEIILNYLTPKSIGLLECTSKNMQNAIRANKVWEHQAVLAWNGFYRDYEEKDGDGERVYTNDVLRFIPVYSGSYREDVEQFILEFSTMNEWRDWEGILGEMEVIGVGHRTLGHATTCPKLVIQNEMTLDEEFDIEDGQRHWVMELKDEIFEDWEEDCEDSDSDNDLI